MDLYYGQMSGNSARSLFALHEAGVPFTPRLLDVRGGENRKPEYLAVNPMGKIPALVDGAFRLWESNAINGYVCEKHRVTSLLPATLEGRASVQRWMFFQAAHVSPSSIPVFRATNRRVQEFWQTKGDPQAADAARKELARWLPVLESALAGREWLEGAFSLADVAYAPHFAMLLEGGYDVSPHPAVRAWLERLLARPAWRKTTELVFAK
jgi:glutathione S-transferase